MKKTTKQKKYREDGEGELIRIDCDGDKERLDTLRPHTHSCSSLYFYFFFYFFSLALPRWIDKIRWSANPPSQPPLIWKNGRGAEMWGGGDTQLPFRVATDCVIGDTFAPAATDSSQKKKMSIDNLLHLLSNERKDWPSSRWFCPIRERNVCLRSVYDDWAFFFFFLLI